MKKYYVYILSNKFRTVYYTGVTNNLNRRMKEHRGKGGSQFCMNYKVWELVYYEVHASILYAIAREKEIKKMKRKDKMKMILAINPKNIDLYSDGTTFC